MAYLKNEDSNFLRRHEISRKPKCELCGSKTKGAKVLFKGVEKVLVLCKSCARSLTRELLMDLCDVDEYPASDRGKTFKQFFGNFFKLLDKNMKNNKWGVIKHG